jgi:hypothetical protein
LLRTSKTALRETIPILGDYKALKSHCDWLFDGEISLLIFQNLAAELENLELFLRLVPFLYVEFWEENS